ncbi:MAG TPA: TraB/GumN family protein [Caulobacteraceae bacterium]|jgi:uncharacterized protein YbaP (TraB family)|nr:TraB/GumN family protein [Caulobacteraceae bacterium]
MRFALPPWTPLRHWAATVIAALAVLGVGAGAHAAPPIWRVHGPKGEVVLFGSVHLLTPGLDWRGPEMKAALAHADSVWFEIPMDGSSDAATARAVGALSKLPAGKSLAALLTADGRARLNRVSSRLGLPPGAIDGYRPWYAEVTLTLLDLRAHGASLSDGVEPSLAREAPPVAPRHAFETPEQQIRILADAPLREQVASLEQTLSQIEDEPNAFDALQKAWLTGDTAWLEREAIEPLRKAAPGMYRRMVSQRNRRWADQIERLLKTPDRAFIVVGVGHLVGPDSVPALLRRRGLKVEGP